MRCLRVGLIGLFVPCKTLQVCSHCLSNIYFQAVPSWLTFEAHAFEADVYRPYGLMNIITNGSLLRCIYRSCVPTAPYYSRRNARIIGLSLAMAVSSLRVLLLVLILLGRSLWVEGEQYYRCRLAIDHQCTA